VPIRLNGMLIRDQHGEAAIWSIVEDITERRRNDERVALFRRIFDASEQAVGVTDAQGHLIYTNRAHEQILGWTADEARGLHFSTFFPAGSLEEFQGEMMTTVLGGKGWTGLISLCRKDGSRVTAACHVGAVKDGKGNVQNLFNIFTDFSDELQRRNELARAKEAAERANQAKSEFLSSMSHELRTPLNAILGFGQLLELESSLSTDGRDNVDEILKAGRHLLVLINEVLDLARVESGRVELSLEPVELLPLVTECLSLVGAAAASRAIALISEGGQGSVVRADRLRLKQVLLNLLSNAVKYNTEGGRVEVSIAEAGGSLVRVEVRDTGPGIAPERLPEIFQPFNRLGAETRGVEGTGIGLTITRRLLELMGGRIGVTSEPGDGSCFWFELPSAESAQTGLAADAAAKGGNAPQSGAADRRRTVLYIEDNPANLKLVRQILVRRPAVDLLTAQTPEEGIELALSRGPDLILLDIQLPGMSGYEVLEVLRASSALRSVPVAAVTANAMPSDVARGRAAGFADYLTKPLDVEILLDRVDRLLMRHGPDRQGADHD
jgi:hypothetical protein